MGVAAALPELSEYTLPICLRDNALFFQNCRTFIKTPGANPRARQKSENPTPRATTMCEYPGSLGRMVRLGLIH